MNQYFFQKLPKSSQCSLLDLNRVKPVVRTASKLVQIRPTVLMPVSTCGVQALLKPPASDAKTSCGLMQQPSVSTGTQTGNNDDRYVESDDDDDNDEDSEDDSNTQVRR